MAEKKTVLVTGAAGSLAKRVIARLHGRYNVIAVDFRRKVETDAGVLSYKRIFSATTRSTR
jgi:UDP-glucose 4-epimerase